MITQLHFIRHGETNWNAEGRIQGQSESELTENGRAQAEELKERLRISDFDAFYCSSSRRTRETIAVLLDGQVDQVRYMDELREIFLGPWEGKLKERIVVEHPREFENFWKNPHEFDLEGAENFYELQKRGLAAVRGIVEENPGRKVLAVSHGAIIKAVLSHCAGRHLSRLWEPPVMYNCARSIVDFNWDGSCRILRFAGSATW